MGFFIPLTLILFHPGEGIFLGISPPSLIIARRVTISTHSSLAANIKQHIRTIRADGIDAKIDQATHVLFFTGIPRANEKALGMGFGDKVLVHELMPDMEGLNVELFRLLH